MTSLPLSLSEFTDAILDLHKIGPGRRGAVQARIKDFQRRGFPAGLNTGKGRRAEYGPEQIFKLVMAFKMLELGFAPERIVGFVEQVWTDCEPPLAYLLARPQNSPPDKDSHPLLILFPDGLGTLRQGETNPVYVLEMLSLFASENKFDELGYPEFALIDLHELAVSTTHALERVLGNDAEPAKEFAFWGEETLKNGEDTSRNLTTEASNGSDPKA